MSSVCDYLMRTTFMYIFGFVRAPIKSHHILLLLYFANPLAVTSAEPVYETIWYDDMERNNGWTDSSAAKFGYDSTGCSDNLCTRLDSSDGIGRDTNISIYSHILLQFDVSNKDMESGEICKVSYSYDSVSDKTLLGEYTGEECCRIFYHNESFYIPSTTTSTTLWIFLEMVASGDDFCYYDNVYLKGVKATTEPTTVPITDPTETEPITSTSTETTEPITSTSTEPTTDPSTAPTESTTRTSTETTNVTYSPVKQSTEAIVVSTVSPSLFSTTLLMQQEQGNTHKISVGVKVGVYSLLSIFSCCVLSAVVAIFYKFKANKSDQYDTDVSTIVIQMEHVETDEQKEEVLKVEDVSQLKVLKEWLTNTVTLPQYYDVFIENGYLNTNMIQDIENTSQLNDIGITKRGHQAFVLSEIDKLRKVNVNKSVSTIVIQMKQVETDEQKVKEWLTNTVKLPQYYDFFVDNGYDSLDRIKEMKEELEFKDIGVVLKGDIMKMMKEIKSLECGEISSDDSDHDNDDLWDPNLSEQQGVEQTKGGDQNISCN